MTAPVRAMSEGSGRDAYNALYVSLLERADPAFPLQHVVDAFAAQTATADSKPITVVFALAGLYLHLEKRYTGKAVQQAHILMARHRRAWPSVPLPPDRGALTAADVIAVAPGRERDAAIDRWCRSVWSAFGESRATIVALLQEQGIV